MSASCANGRVNPSVDTKLRLFADSAGHCNKPQCHRNLFSDLSSADYNIGEVAHVIAASVKGPRASEKISAEDKAAYDNLILLCPSCHTEIDKAPELFPVELVRSWKVNHKKQITDIIGIPIFENRNDARDFLLTIFRTNKAIFDSLNPDLPYRENPEAEEAVVWKRKMLSQIIPNNQKAVLFLDLNRNLLNEDELLILENYRQHVDDLIERHLGDNSGIASRFPEKIRGILIN
jgi:hypothetical protein